MKNNFTIGDSHCSLIACLIDDMLSKSNEYITVRQVLTLYNNKPDGSFEDYQMKAIPFYHDCREAVSNISEYLKEKGLSLVYANGKNTEEGFKYPLEDTNPLTELRNEHSRKLDKSILEQFSKSCVGIVPESMLNYFMKGTMLLLNAKNAKKAGKQFVESGTFPYLKQIELLPIFYIAIVEHKVVKFQYQPFGKKSYNVILHPHFLKEYNSRWFVFGITIDNDGNMYADSAYPLDRMETTPEYHDAQYIPQKEGYWANRFNDIIGVRLPSPEVVSEEIIIKTLNPQVHGRLMTKLLHISQHEIHPFDVTKGYGEISLKVKPNPELLATLLSFGSNIEIVSSYRDVIADELQLMVNMYKNTN